MGKCMIAIDTVEENFNDKDVRRTTQWLAKIAVGNFSETTKYFFFVLF
jgi:hypothetical protein